VVEKEASPSPLGLSPGRLPPTPSSGLRLGGYPTRDHPYEPALSVELFLSLPVSKSAARSSPTPSAVNGPQAVIIALSGSMSFYPPPAPTAGPSTLPSLANVPDPLAHGTPLRLSEEMLVAYCGAPAWRKPVIKQRLKTDQPYVRPIVVRKLSTKREVKESRL
jgi:hypothetical protein